MSKANRGEIWIADLGMVAKVRPVLIMSVGYGESERALVTCVIRTTHPRGTPYEVLHQARGMLAGAFDAQGLTTIPDAKLERRVGSVSDDILIKVEDAICAWLGL